MPVSSYSCNSSNTNSDNIDFEDHRWTGAGSRDAWDDSGSRVHELREASRAAEQAWG